jgi:hypothetical protein
VYQQQEQEQQQQQQQQQKDAENPFLDPPFSRIKKLVDFPYNNFDLRPCLLTSFEQDIVSTVNYFL